MLLKANLFWFSGKGVFKMSDHLQKAIEELETKLQEQLNEAAETKKAINVLCRQLGQIAPYEDVSVQAPKGRTSGRRDEYYRKPLATAVKDYLTKRGSAASLDEIYEALEQGGFEFVGKDESTKKRGLQISLAKNRALFAYLKATSTFGLWEFYGGRPKGQKNEGTPTPTENEPPEDGSDLV